MMTRYLALLLTMLGALTLGAERARALEARCIEAARYRNLLQVFNDDTRAFYTYFDIEKRQAIDPTACRALILSGPIKAGDAETVLTQVIQNKGWLSVLYLAAQGTDSEEEVKLAHLIRRFGLKTRVVTGSKFRYEPDFATRTILASRSTAEAELAQTADMMSLDAGLRDFARRDDLEISVAEPFACQESCIGLWAAGVTRWAPRLTPAASAANATPPAPDAAAKLRIALTQALDPDQSQPNDRPVTLGGLPSLASATGRAAREVCAAEISAVEAISTRIAGATDELARRNFRLARTDVMSQQFLSLRRAGIRLQQCLAGVLERERLASFHKLCEDRCDHERIGAVMAKSAREFLDSVSKN